MSTEIKVPEMGESVSEATVARWFKQVGDAVVRDEPLLELETDKVTVEVPSPTDGALERIDVDNGGTVTVGAVLGAVNEGASGNPTPVITNNPEAVSPKREAPQAPTLLASLDGAAPPVSPAPSVPRQVHPLEERVAMSRLRKTIAQRLKESQNTAAMLTTFNEADMSAVIDLRTSYKDGFEKQHGVKLGFMSFFVKACIAGLKDFPAINAEIDGDDIVYKRHYDIGVAVSTPRGLVVPVVAGADKLSLSGLEKAIADLGARARDSRLRIEELMGGTFSITNGGVFGSLLSTPILNAPQAGILGMHKIQNRPVAVDGQVAVRPMMYLALSYDHRLVDGREAVSFLVRVKECLEDPRRMLLDL
jgi:2-oxoglutarate dehydrogenase E2 component (dihydrolipoamide succinyltransferase)